MSFDRGCGTPSPLQGVFRAGEGGGDPFLWFCRCGWKDGFMVVVFLSIARERQFLELLQNV